MRTAPATPSAPSLSATVRTSGSSGLGRRPSFSARSRCWSWWDCTFTWTRPPCSSVTRVSARVPRGHAHRARRLLCTVLHSAFRRPIAVATILHVFTRVPAHPVPPRPRSHLVIAPGANAPQPPCFIRHCCSHFLAPAASSSGWAPLVTRAMARSASRKYVTARCACDLHGIRVRRRTSRRPVAVLTFASRS